MKKLIVLLFLLVCAHSFADTVPKLSTGTTYRYYSNSTEINGLCGIGFYSSVNDAKGTMYANWCNAQRPKVTGQACISVISWGEGIEGRYWRSDGYCADGVIWGGGVSKDVIANTSCPPNSTYNGSSCTCSENTIAQNGQCVTPPVDPCEQTQGLTTGLTSVLVQFDNVNVTASSLGTFIGQNVTTAVPINGNNCAATGQVTDCGLFPSNSGGGSTLLCHLSGTTYTGSTYTDQQTLFGLPKVDPEATPVEEQHGVCPAGQYGGNVNGQAVCVKPNGSANTTSSTTTNADGSTTTTTSTTSCVGDECTETKTTSGTDAQGNSTGTSSTSTQADKAAFCEDNPNDAACKSGTATASCDAFICDGDAVNCAMLKKQWQDSCKLFNPDNDASSIYNKAVAGTDGFSIEGMKTGAEIIDVGSFDTTGSGWSRSCPADKIINVPVIGSFTISFQQYCPLLNSFSMVLLSITLLACIMWCVKD